MNPEDGLEKQLESLGVRLRENPSLTGRVMSEVRKAVGDSISSESEVERQPHTPRLRGPFVITTAACLMLVALLVLVTLPKRSVGWEEINRSIGKQKWIRARSTYPNGQPVTIWMSAEEKIWALQTTQWFRLSDGTRKVTFEYHGTGAGDSRISRVRLTDDEAQKFASRDFNRDDVSLSHWLFGERLVQQQRCEVGDDGKSWIDFQFSFVRSRDQGTLRVDPASKLPVFIEIGSQDESRNGKKWVFDYPEQGPRDIYALGVPPNVEIDDHIPSAAAEKALDGLAASRAKIGDFRLDVLVVQPSVANGQAINLDNYSFYRVWRKGTRWRIDHCRALPQGIDGRHAAPDEPEAGMDLAVWFESLFGPLNPLPYHMCDGKTVFEQSQTGPIASWKRSSRITPEALLSADGFGLRGPATFVADVFPDGRFANRGWKYEFDPNPADEPGCVVYKLAANINAAQHVAHEWYYLDPKMGYAVVRAELFNLPKGTPADLESAVDLSTTTMQNFQKSPQGFWYPSVIRQTSIDPQGAHQTAFYQFDFNDPLADELFELVEESDGRPAKE